MHYGVKGMKWGVRKAIEDDGSLSRVGKERSYTDDESKEMLKKSMTRNGVINDAARFLKKQRESAMDDLVEYDNGVRKDIQSFKNDKAFRERVLKNMDDVLDKNSTQEDIDDFADRIVANEIDKSLSKETKQYRDSFGSKCNDYMENVKNITDDIVGNYGDKKISTLTYGRQKYRDIVYSQLQGVGNQVDGNYMDAKMIYMEIEFKEYTQPNYYGFDDYYTIRQDITNEWLKTRRNK